MKLKTVFLAALISVAAAASPSPYPKDWPYPPVVTPNGASLPWTVKNGVKEFRLRIEEFEHEMAPGMKIRAWGYNGATPGPTLEVVQGDRVRIIAENRLPEETSIHWHGVLLPNGMDGVSGLNQPPIRPGETFVYEFTVDQEPATLMYHSHADEMVQMGMGAMGFFIIHPRNPKAEPVDRDFAIFLNEWDVEPGSSRPNPNEMTDFNMFSFNGRIYPGTAPLLARSGDRVRFRFANVGQDVHPIHLHGHRWWMTATDGGPIPKTARIPETTVLVSPGQTRDVILDKAVAGDWALHCHRRHHPMNAMGHELPNMMAVPQSDLEDKIRQLVPGYMAMGEAGMHEHAEHAEHMELPENTLPMMTGKGPFGTIGMGGMFTVLKVRDRGQTSFEGWYAHPKGSVAHRVGPSPSPSPKTRPSPTPAQYQCPMHPEVSAQKPGNCPKCGMKLEPLPEGHHPKH